jgi:hypothetical protein
MKETVRASEACAKTEAVGALACSLRLLRSRRRKKEVVRVPPVLASFVAATSS